MQNGTMYMSKFARVATLVAILVTTRAATSFSSVITDDLGSASQFSVLQYNTSNVSDSAFQGGPIGVVNGNWVQSGGGTTNTQQAETVYLSSGFTNNGPQPPLSTVNNTGFVTSAWSAATSASATFASMTPTVGGITSVTGNTTITENAVGNYVFNITSFASNSNLMLSAPKGSTFVLNISTGSDIHLNSNSWSLGGGLTANDVVYNFLNGTGLQTAGGGNGTQINGIVLDTTGAIQLHPGQVNGEVIAQTFTSSSGAMVVKPPTLVPEASAGWALIPFVGAIFVASARRFRRKEALSVA